MTKSIITSVILLGLLTSCASQYHVSTNLDKQNFKDYFSPSKVKIYQTEQDFPARYKALGLVEGESCQTKEHQAPPNEIDARTDARKKAYDKGANGIIFSGCALIENDQADRVCLRTRVCYGRAFYLEQQ